jgi:hypothetical protein
MTSARVILPKGSVFKPKELDRAIRNTLTATAKAIKVDLALPAATWKHTPTITIRETGPYERTIEVADEVYAMLEKGTKKHDIPKRWPPGRPPLRFTMPFRPKTRPNYLGSTAGSTGSTVVWRRRKVRHPGTKARNWMKTAKTKWDAEAPKIFQRAIDSEFG